MVMISIAESKYSHCNALLWKFDFDCIYANTNLFSHFQFYSIKITCEIFFFMSKYNNILKQNTAMLLFDDVNEENQFPSNCIYSIKDDTVPWNLSCIRVSVGWLFAFFLFSMHFRQSKYDGYGPKNVTPMKHIHGANAMVLAECAAQNGVQAWKVHYFLQKLQKLKFNTHKHFVQEGTFPFAPRCFFPPSVRSW